VKQKPYLKAPDDDLDPETAARIAWENHKKRNRSIMVEMFDVRPCCFLNIYYSGRGIFI